MHVEVGDDDHEHEGREDECDRGRERTASPCFEIANPHDDLCRERPRHRLAEGNAVQEVLPIEPSASLDKVALHVADSRDRPAETPRAEAEEVSDHLREGW